jgi:hypothetical protein
MVEKCIYTSDSSVMTLKMKELLSFKVTMHMRTTRCRKTNRSAVIPILHMHSVSQIHISPL